MRNKWAKLCKVNVQYESESKITSLLYVEVTEENIELQILPAVRYICFIADAHVKVRGDFCAPSAAASSGRSPPPCGSTKTCACLKLRELRELGK